MYLAVQMGTRASGYFRSASIGSTSVVDQSIHSPYLFRRSLPTSLVTFSACEWRGRVAIQANNCFPGWYFVVFTMGIFGRRKIFLSYVASLSHAYAGIVRASSQDVSVQLSQELFYENGTVYDQLLILNSDFIVDPDLLAEQGLPFYASTWVIHLLVSNLGMAATFTHLLLWNRKDLEAAWSWMRPSGLRRMWANRKSFDWRIWKDDGMRNREVVNADAMKEMDPHYREMLKYADAPNSWYATILLCACIAALVVIYKTDSTLPWCAKFLSVLRWKLIICVNRWGFLVALSLGALSILFFGALYAITGLSFSIQPFVQMIGGFILHGKPMANMYFVVFSSSMLTSVPVSVFS